MPHSRILSEDLEGAPVSRGRCSYTLVVPTWNEEHWLPRLLRSIDNWRTIQEIIIADNCSTDATARCARDYGCAIVRGGNPAQGRNAGARRAGHDLILFADADVVLPISTLQYLDTCFDDDEIAAVHFKLIPLAASAFIKACYRTMDLYFEALTYLGRAQGVGSLIAVRKRHLDAINGFREHILVGEDADFFRRIATVGHVKYVRDTCVYVSARRFKLENPILFATKTLLWAILRLFGSSASFIPYVWKRYSLAMAYAEEEHLRLLAAEFQKGKR